MKGKVCGDFCEFILDKGHFITGDRKIHKEDRKLKWRSWGGCGKIMLEFCLYFDE